MNKEYVIIDKKAIEAAIEELENEILKSNPITGTLIKGLISTYKDVLSQSTPLIPEIEKAFNAGRRHGLFPFSCLSKEGYISQLKLDI